MPSLRLSRKKSFVMNIFFSIILSISFVITNAAPRIYRYHHHTQKPLNDESAVSHDTVYNYLMEFDYLPKSDIETGALRTEEQLRDAIKLLQSFGNIPVTGEIDSATKQLIMRPRCGVGDGNSTNEFSSDNSLIGSNGGHRRIKRYVLQGAKWSKTDLTWSLVNQSMPEAGQIRRNLHEALGVWERSSKLTFREVYSDQADIQVLFASRDHGDGNHFDGPGQVLAHAFYPGVGRGGDAHFDAEETWIFEGTNQKGTIFKDVALHEFGHSLGLGHSSDQSAIMYPWYKEQGTDGVLPDDDRLAIQELYGLKEKIWGPYRPQRPPATTTTTTTTSTTTTMRPMIYYPQHNPHHHHNNYYPYHHYTPSPTRTTTTTTTTTTTRRPTTTTTTHKPRIRHTTTRPYIHTSKHHNQNHHTPRPKPAKPDTCQTTYDAISMIRRELFIFKDQFIWRIGDRGLYPGFPLETRRLWNALPENFGKIDAVYENKDRKIIFFIGRYYYAFDSVTLMPGYPKPLTTLGLPSGLTHIDAAFVWGHNNRTYLFSGTLYWKLDEDVGRVELDYPRDMSIWAGIGYNIDAAFQYINGKTYFFKNFGYWEFNDSKMKVAYPRAKRSSRKWMNCPRRSNDIEEEQTWTAPLVSEREENEFSSTINEGKSSGCTARFKTLFINRSHALRLLSFTSLILFLMSP